MTVSAGLDVVVLNRQRRRRVDAARLRGVLGAAADALGVSGGLALVLAGDPALGALNQRYRGKSRPTDVLSFAGSCGGHAEPRTRRRRAQCQACARGAAELGDIVISVETAERNARGLGRTLPEELDVLAVHGLLHLLGYDHETDDGTMDRLERRLRNLVLPKRTRERGSNSPRPERAGGEPEGRGGVRPIALPPWHGRP